MRLTDIFLCLGCVSMVSMGQALLRGAAKRASESGDGFVAGLLATYHATFAVGVYAVAMLAWLYVLARVPLSQAFPFFGLCFFLVPVFARVLLGDPVGSHTWWGASIICAGIVVSSWRG